jgi:hypothetical protein
MRPKGQRACQRAMRPAGQNVLNQALPEGASDPAPTSPQCHQPPVPPAPSATSPQFAVRSSQGPGRAQPRTAHRPGHGHRSRS